MSTRTIDEQFMSVIEDLTQLLTAGETPPEETPGNQLEKKYLYIQFFKSLYVQYVKVFCKMEEVYDHTLQPQKREDQRALLETIGKRIIEVKHILRKLAGEYIDFDDTLVDLKETPKALEIAIPKYFKEDNEEEFKKRLIQIRAMQEKHGIQDQSKIDDQEVVEYTEEMTVEQAVLIIQTAERARQGRHIARATQQVRAKERRMMRLEREGLKSRPESAVIIQSHFRAYLQRKKAREERRKELEFLGMVMPGAIEQEEDKSDITNLASLLSKKDEGESRSDVLKAKNELAYSQLKMIQRQNVVELQQQRKELRQKILRQDKKAMLMDMKDAIMERLILYKQITGKDGIPPFPSEKDGGSKQFMKEMEEEEARKKMEEIEAAKKATKKAKSGTKKGAKKKTTSTKKPKKGDKKDSEKATKKNATLELEFDTGQMLSLLKDIVQKWGDHTSHMGPVHMQGVDMERLREELTQGDDGIEEEIRKQADNLIREELKNLKAALEAEKATKKKKKAKKRLKGNKGPKGNKKEESPEEAMEKERKILQSNMALLELFVSHEIVQLYPQRRIQDYIGEFIAPGSVLNQWPHPSMGQVRQSIAEIILQLGEKNMRCPGDNVRSLLLFGPRGTGKDLIVNIIASETNATLFRINYTRLLDAANGAEHSKATKSTMLQGVFLLANYMQPSVIVMEDMDVVYEATRKNATITKIRKVIENGIAKIKSNHQVLFIGLSHKPWSCDKSMQKLFDRRIYTVLPDHGSTLLLWTKMIEERIGRPLPHNFDIDVLAYISYLERYASGMIQGVINRVLTPRRIKRLDLRPLSVSEFIGPMSRVEPIGNDVLDKFSKYVSSLPLRYRRRTEADEAAEIKVMEEEAAAKKEERKKKRR